MNDVAGKDYGTWEFQLESMKMASDRDKYIEALAEKKFYRMRMRDHVRSALGDETLLGALRAQAWLEADPTKVTLDADGKIQCPSELPIGCGSDHYQAKIAERLYPEEAVRAEHAWLWSDDDETQ